MWVPRDTTPRSTVGSGSRQIAPAAKKLIPTPWGVACAWARRRRAREEKRECNVRIGSRLEPRGSQAWTNPSLPPWTRYSAVNARQEISGDSVYMIRSGSIVLTISADRDTGRVSWSWLQCTFQRVLEEFEYPFPTVPRWQSVLLAERFWYQCNQCTSYWGHLKFHFAVGNKIRFRLWLVVMWQLRLSIVTIIDRLRLYIYTGLLILSFRELD